MSEVTLWVRTIPAGTYGFKDSIPVLPRRARKMNKRRLKKWLRSVSTLAIAKLI